MSGTIFQRLTFRFELKPLPIIGACFILYAIVIYPLLGISFGHSYPKAPYVWCCSLSNNDIHFWIIVWATKPVPIYVLVIPFLWSIVGMSAAVNLRVPQDYGLVVAGVLGTVLILIRNRKAKRSVSLSGMN